MHTLRYITIFFIGRKVYFFWQFSYVSHTYAVSLALIWSQMLEGRHSSELLIYRLVSMCVFTGKARNCVGHLLSALLLESIEGWHCSSLLTLLDGGRRVDSGSTRNRVNDKGLARWSLFSLKQFVKFYCLGLFWLSRNVIKFVLGYRLYHQAAIEFLTPNYNLDTFSRTYDNVFSTRVTVLPDFNTVLFLWLWRTLPHTFMAR